MPDNKRTLIMPLNLDIETAMQIKKIIYVACFFIIMVLIATSVIVGYLYIQERKRQQETNEFIDALSTPFKMEWEVKSEIKKLRDGIRVELKTSNLENLKNRANDIRLIIAKSTTGNEKNDQRLKKLSSTLPYKAELIGFQLTKISYGDAVAENDVRNLIATIEHVKPDISEINSILNGLKLSEIPSATGSASIEQDTAEDILFDIENIDEIIEIFERNINYYLELANSLLKDKYAYKNKIQIADLSSINHSSVNKNNIIYEQIKSIEDAVLKQAATFNTASEVDGLLPTETAMLQQIGLINIRWLTNVYLIFKSTSHLSANVLTIGRDAKNINTIFKNIENNRSSTEQFKSILKIANPLLQKILQITNSIAEGGSSGLMSSGQSLSQIEIFSGLIDFRQYENLKILLPDISSNPNKIIWQSPWDPLLFDGDGKPRLKIISPVIIFSSFTDAFSHLNVVTTANTEIERTQKINQKINSVLGSPIITAVKKSDDGQWINFQISSLAMNLNIACQLPFITSISEDLESRIKYATPIVTFTFKNNQLYLSEIVLDDDTTASVAMNIKIPVRFSNKDAEIWQSENIAHQKNREIEAAKIADDAIKAEAKIADDRIKAEAKIAEKQNKLAIEQQKQHEEALAKDQIYMYAQGLVSNFRPYGPCQMIAKSIMSFAASSNSDYIRQRQINTLFDKTPEMCLQ